MWAVMRMVPLLLLEAARAALKYAAARPGWLAAAASDTSCAHTSASGSTCGPVVRAKRVPH